MPTLLRYTLLILAIFALEFTVLFSPIEKMGAYLSGLSRASSGQLECNENRLSSERVSNGQLRALQDENTHLKDLLKFSERSEHISLLARRIGRSTDPLNSSIVIDRGSRDGIHPGDPVVVGDGLLIGTIQQVDESRSFMVSLTDSRSKILASIVQEKKEIRGIAEGQFNTGLSMTLIPISAELKKDDLVITSGLQERIPAGLVLGTVDSIVKNPEDLFQSALLKNVASIDEYALLTVLVSTNTN